MLDIKFMIQGDDSLEFALEEHVKQSRPGYKPPSVVLKALPEDGRLCVFEHMKEYLSGAKLLRGSEIKLFISFAKPFKHVSRDTISR